MANHSTTSIEQQVNAIHRLVAKALLTDRMAARRELARLRKGKGTVDRTVAQLQTLEGRLQRSVAIRRARQAQPLRLQVDPQLPIHAMQDELITAIQAHPVVIVAGETGSGKTTQLPKLCLAAGRGVDGIIGVTQPRRIAALTVGRRMAEELGESVGQTVGIKIRFQENTGDRTRVKVMTDGILLAEAQSDRFLNAYDTLIVDEAHERSLNIDFILGLLKQMLSKRRDLKVIITSATIDTEKFSRAFDQAPVIQVSGRMYPVETRYVDPLENNGEEATHVELAVAALDRLQQERRRGDVLVFMPTEQDIRDTCELIQGRRYPGTEVTPLFARLSAADQQRVFQPAKGRKIVVATNVAETSITIPGIRYVIDTGLARISQYTPRSRTNTLPVVPISRSSADQRQGRCGRVANGICIRLYSEADYLQRPRFTPPEILRSNLAEVILRMIALKLGDVAAFPFIDPPAPKSIQDGYSLLLELGAIAPVQNRVDSGGRFTLTAKGRVMARLPLDPRLACMLLEAHQRKCLPEVAVIAAALSIQDPRERPADKQAQADEAHARFADPASDFITLLNLWHQYGQATARRTSWQTAKKFCREHFLAFRRMREWRDVHQQIVTELAEHDIRADRPPAPPPAPGDMGHSAYAAIHQAILSGFLSNIGLKKEKQIFQAAHGRQAMVFPGSGVFKNPGQWIVAAEMVETSRLFARCVGNIDPAWIEPVGRAQCKYTYLDPRWERRREAVVATEQVSLYGLIVDRRPRPYGPIDPAEASGIFIRQALIMGDVRRPLPFMQHNQRLIADIEEMQDRLRRKDLLVDEEVLLHLYRERLGQVYDIRGLHKLIEQAGGDDFLRFSKVDLLYSAPEADQLARFPEQVAAGDLALALQYRFAPGEENDGVTLQVPETAAGAVADEAVQWLVPGLLGEKIAALIRALPKEHRRKLVPINETVQTIVDRMPADPRTRIATALSRFIRNQWGVAIPETAWNEGQLPDYLRMRIAVTDPQGRILRAGRDTGVLTGPGHGPAPPDDFDRARRAWERGPIDAWDFGDLPETVALPAGKGRAHTGYPCLEARADTVILTALADRLAARRTHPQGVKALLMVRFKSEIKFLRKNLALPYESHALCRYIGGRQALEEQLFQRVLDEQLARDVRTSAAFEDLAALIAGENMAAWGQTKRRHLLTILDAYHALRTRLADIERAHPANAAMTAFLNDLRGMLGALAPDNLIALYSDDRLTHLPRYIRAISMRAERGVLDLEKDQAKASQIAPFARRLQALVRDLTPNTSAERRQAVEDFFWMLEEFRIAVFAPEVKTAHPVSAKRLEKQFKELEQMI
ncbi:MAG: ATP-dependent RNA helicase HrpA [Desulfatitalea sp.]|nr:ATP-dependent RNA helicase HrpA [Desulfatitalea sp.]